ncbi:hypothetical protein Dda_5447 [Drechslerella dactyloides]|uniref:Formin GTPase-binding domain-containing protein n=1 Tax=Drechslerella dactyloides TaxID=74499 RepID=A0AAD6IWJ3_DREDA|nr:hypothetical protein Dda_5447 [Drechslerella dactyloides]
MRTTMRVPPPPPRKRLSRRLRERASRIFARMKPEEPVVNPQELEHFEHLMNQLDFHIASAYRQMMAEPPLSPLKRASRLLGRHRHSMSIGDFLVQTPGQPPQLPPLDFNFVSGAPPQVPPKPQNVQPSKGHPNKPKHGKSPSLMDLFKKKDKNFTIYDADDHHLHFYDYATTNNSTTTMQHHRIFSPESTQSGYTNLTENSTTVVESRALLPSPSFSNERDTPAEEEGTTMLNGEPSQESSGEDAATYAPGDRDNSVPRSCRPNLPPINTDIPADLAAEISLYTPRNYTASQQRNFSTTPSLRTPSRPTSVYGPTERKTSWGSAKSIGRRNSTMETTSDAKTVFSNDSVASDVKPSRVLTRVRGVGSKRVHPAALRGQSTYSVNREFSDLLSGFGLPRNIKSGASEMAPHVKASLLKGSKVMSSTPLPPPSRGGQTDAPATDFTTMPPPPPPRPSTQANGQPREKKRRPLSSIGAAIFRSVDNVRPRGKTLSTIGLPGLPKHSDEKVRPRTTVSEKASKTEVAAVPVTPTSPNAVSNPITDPLHARSPNDFVDYLKGKEYQAVNLGWLRQLRRLLRGERLAWVEAFFELNGLDCLVALLKNIYELEYHDLQSGNVLKEVFLCLKAAYTAPMADVRFDAMHRDLFPLILSIMFDEERKKTPHEYETREAAIGILFTYLAQAPLDKQVERARSVASILGGPEVTRTNLGPTWIASVSPPRPYTRWSGEVARLTYETGWVWYHPSNRIALREDVDPEVPYNIAHFPTPREFMAIDGGSVSSVENHVANYAALHLEIMNAIIAYLPTVGERNDFRELIRRSGMERTMGTVLRLAGKGPHYEHLANLHSALSDWVTAAKADEWTSWENVRNGKWPQRRSISGNATAGGEQAVRAMRKIEAIYGPQYELPNIGGLGDTVAARNRMSIQGGEEVAFEVDEDGQVVPKWDF